MALTSGTRLGSYEIVAPLGAGGMGEVYRARDTALDRDVAIKVLPDSFANDPDRLMRVTREAKTLASLNHPNIAAIYGLEERALVMELVEGEDLSQRIARGPIPLREALPIARQIADALEAAHEAGIIHRDLKPANIKVRDDGTVKVLDFGLAKAAQGASLGDGPSLATMTSPAMTQMGMILGTAAYMAPEQAKGKPVNRRADVWAFGVVFYEMLTGGRLFGREDVSDTLAAVLTSEPNLTLLPRDTPSQIRQLLARCLTKDKRQRLDSMAMARLEIEDAQRAPTAASASSGRGTVWRVAAGCIAGAFLLGWLASRYAATAGSPVPSSAGASVAEIPAPIGVLSAFHDGFALSPDGETLVFAARNLSGLEQLWTRRMDAAAARAIPGTEGGSYPFWSPTGEHIAFFSGTHLRRIPAIGGEPQTICEVFGRFPSGSWGVRDEILFASWQGQKTRILKVPASGGTPVAIESIGRAIRPAWLTDGRRFLYAGGSADANGVYLTDSVGGAPKLIVRLPGESWAFAYAASGYLLLNRNDVLTAQKLDADAGALVGPIATVSGVAGTPKEWMAVSAAGDRLVGLVKQPGNGAGDPGDPLAKLQWVMRDGTPAGELGDIGRFWTVALSPDGKRAAVNQSEDIWLFDETNRKTRVTSGGNGVSPVWSFDGTAMVFQRDSDLWRQSIDRDAPATELAGSKGVPTDWSKDGRWLLMASDSAGSGRRDIKLYDMQSHTARAWLETEANEAQGRFSPDGRWIAYTSDSSGQDEIYVRSLESAGKVTAVSSGGGVHPRWGKEGRELYFLGPSDEMMAVDVSLGSDTVNVGTPKRLFTIPLNDITRSFFSPYDVTRDGQRFLLNVPASPAPLFFLQGLDALVRKSADKGGK